MVAFGTEQGRPASGRSRLATPSPTPIKPAVVIESDGDVVSPLAEVATLSGGAAVYGGRFSTIEVALVAGDDSKTLVEQLLG